jgi:hypothetical protein
MGHILLGICKQPTPAIRLPSPVPTPPPHPRDHDAYLMEVFYNHKATSKEMELLNTCQIYLQVITYQILRWHMARLFCPQLSKVHLQHAKKVASHGRNKDAHQGKLGLFGSDSCNYS